MSALTIDSTTGSNKNVRYRILSIYPNLGLKTNPPGSDIVTSLCVITLKIGHNALYERESSLAPFYMIAANNDPSTRHDIMFQWPTTTNTPKTLGISGNKLNDDTKIKLE